MLSQKPTKVPPKTRIEARYEPHFFGPDIPGSHMAFIINPQGPFCKLTLELDNIPPGQEGVSEGWERLADSLKSWLETGTSINAQM